MKLTAIFPILIGCLLIGGLVIAQNNRFSEKPRKEASQPLPPSLQNIPETDGSRNIDKTTSQQLARSRALTARVIRDSAGVPVFIDYRRTLKTANRGRASMSAAALDYVAQLKPYLQLTQPTEELEVTTIEEDELKQTHIRLQQHFKGVPVYGGELIVHLENNRFTALNGRHFKTPVLASVTPVLTEVMAVQSALTDLKKETVVRELNAGELQLLKKQVPETELVVYYPENSPEIARLAWRMVVRPNFMERWNYFVDASTGEILSKTNHTCALDGPVKATARDLNGANQSVNAYLKGTTYYLLDITRPMYKSATSTLPDNPLGGIWTIDARNSKADDISVWQVTSANNSWTPLAVSAHTNASAAYLYYDQIHKRNSLDGKGGNVISVVNVRDEDGKEMDNAFWNGQIMAYGNGATAFGPLAGGLDVAAHEMTHGVIESTAGLEYQGQSGAINESLADVFGVLVDRANWTIGESVVKKAIYPSGALRDMANPNQGGTNDPGYQPRTMAQYVSTTKDNGGVHINSGIPNYAFFLFTNNANVGKDKAEKVYYRAMTNYLTRFSKFIDLRLAVIKAATDIFGANSAEVTAARSAFDQVGIVESGGNTPPANPTTLPTNTGTEFLLVYGADKKLYSTSTTGTNITVKSNRAILNRPSVTDDGKFVYFVSDDRRIRAISLVGNPDETLVSDETIWNKVAISKDGRKLAALTNQSDKSIYVYSFDLKKWNKFKLYNPTYTGGVSTGDVQYADGLEWDASGEYLVYDAYNQLKTATGQSLDYWDVGFMRVWDAVQSNFADGTIQKLFNDLEEGESVGNPSFAKNSTATLSFDYLYDPDNTFAILGVNLEKGDVEVITTNTAIGYPDYSRLDDRIVYVTKGTGTNKNVNVIGLNADKITGKGTPSALLLNATWPLWISQGTRSLPTLNFPTIADKFQDAAPFTVSATASNGDAIAFMVVSGPAQISGNRITLTGSGTVTIRAYTNSERPFFPVITAERSFQVIPILSTAPNLGEEVQIFPNPVQNELHVRVAKSLEAGPAELSDMNGRVFTPKVSGESAQETVLDLKSLPTGHYILSIPTNKGTVRQKVMKQ
ncbi:MAG: M4 family metallopeptidase [Spirosomataceae bacterium]